MTNWPSVPSNSMPVPQGVQRRPSQIEVDASRPQSPAIIVVKCLSMVLYIKAIALTRR